MYPFQYRIWSFRFVYPCNVPLPNYHSSIISLFIYIFSPITQFRILSILVFLQKIYLGSQERLLVLLLSLPYLCSIRYCTLNHSYVFYSLFLSHFFKWLQDTLRIASLKTNEKGEKEFKRLLKLRKQKQTTRSRNRGEL